MSISISPICDRGHDRRPSPNARRPMTIDLASSSSGENGIVRMSSTPRSNALSLVGRSPRRVSPRIGVPLGLSVFEAPSRWSSAVLSSWSMSTIAMCGIHSPRTRSASSRLRAVRTTNMPWLRVSSMRSATIGPSWRTSAWRASSAAMDPMPCATYFPHLGEPAESILSRGASPIDHPAVATRMARHGSGRQA